jgi:hypothetical protein
MLQGNEETVKSFLEEINAYVDFARVEDFSQLLQRFGDNTMEKERYIEVRTNEVRKHEANADRQPHARNYAIQNLGQSILRS